MKIPNWLAAIVITIVLGLVGYVFFQAAQANSQPAISPRSAKPAETAEDRLWRLRSEAEASAQAWVSNHVVGHRRTKFCSANTLAENITNWTGIAEVEFINKIGGVDTRFVYFKFWNIQGRPIPHLDFDKVGNF